MIDERMILMIGVARCVWVRFGGVRDPISGRVAGSDGQTMANLEVRELKKRISQPRDINTSNHGGFDLGRS